LSDAVSNDAVIPALPVVFVGPETNDRVSVPDCPADSVRVPGATWQPVTATPLQLATIANAVLVLPLFFTVKRAV